MALCLHFPCLIIPCSSADESSAVRVRHQPVRLLGRWASPRGYTRWLLLGSRVQLAVAGQRGVEGGSVLLLGTALLRQVGALVARF